MTDPLQKFASLEPGQILTPEDLKGLGEAIFGNWGWQTRIAEALEVDGSTVRRWVSGAVAVPGPAKVALRLLLEQKSGKRIESTAPASGNKTPARKRSAP